jgi:hypothetical protein
LNRNIEPGGRIYIERGEEYDNAHTHEIVKLKKYKNAHRAPQQHNFFEGEWGGSPNEECEGL